MKKIFLLSISIFFSLVLVLPSIQGADVKKPIQKAKVPKGALSLETTYHALIIGNNQYKYLPKLKTAHNDAGEVEKLLKEKFKFQTELLLDATRVGILDRINDLRKRLGEKDSLLIYYAGHGEYDKTVDKSYWLPVDAQKDNPTNWIMADDITSNIKRITARHVLIVSDSCYSGTLGRQAVTELISSGGREGYLKKMQERPSRTLMASGGNEPVSDSGGGNNSIFAAAFIKSLEESDKESFTAEEIFHTRIKEIVAGKSDQVPEYSNIKNSGHEGGDFVFVLPQKQVAGLAVQRLEEADKLKEEQKALAEEIARLEAERKQLEERQKLEEKRRKLAEEKARLEAKKKEEEERRKQAEGQKRLEAERLKEEKERKLAEAQKKQEEEQQRIEAEKKRIEEESQRLEAEKKARESVVTPSLPPSGSSPPSIYIDSVTGIEMVLIKGGCYQMGDTFGDGYDNEKPVHEVCVDDFYLGKYEVTQGQWKAIMGNNPANFKSGDNYPVEGVSWYGAQEFIQQLNDKSGKKYRLPTEAEWEYAARSGGKKEKWAGTSNESEIGDYAWYTWNSGLLFYRKTHPVGEKRPNGLGLYDMTGNVWEWCQDTYIGDAYKLHPRNNPKYTGAGADRVLRGGSWSDRLTYTRAAVRYSFAPDAYYGNHIGFRLAGPK